MARFSIKYGEQGRLANTDFVAGQILVTTDSRAIYVDKPNGSTKADRIRIGDFQVVDFLDATDKGESEGTVLPDPSTAGTQLYFVKSVNALAIAKGDAWIQLNPDTGATGVTVVGTGAEGAIRAGDVITSASYNPSTRTITFTASRVTAANVDRGSSNVNDDLTAVEGRLTTLEGSGAGSVAKAVSDAIGALDTTNDVTIASVSSDVVTIKAGVKEVDGVIAQGTGSDITLAKVAKTGVATDVEYKAETSEGAGDSESVGAALARLDGNASTSGSVAKAVKDAVEGLDVNEFALASVNNNVVNIKGIKEVDGKISVGDGVGINLEEVAYTGAAVDVSIADAGEKITATNVEGALAELADAIADATAAGDVTCETSDPESGDILKVYSFYQGLLTGDDAAAKASKKIVDVNIPRDYLVKTAEVKTVDTVDTPYSGAEVGDKYIDFTVNTKDSAGTATHLYIPVDDLMSAISGSTGAEITVTISANNQISATVNKIAASKIIYRAADTEQGISEQTVAQKIVEVEGEITSAIEALDADLDASGTAAHAGTFVVAGVTEVNGVLTAVDSVEVENAGAAAAAQSAVTGTASDTASDLTLNGLSKKADGILGTSSDTATANTVYGAKAAASVAQGEVDALETYVGTIPSTATATDVVGYINEKVNAAVEWGTF